MRGDRRQPREAQSSLEGATTSAGRAKRSRGKPLKCTTEASRRMPNGAACLDCSKALQRCLDEQQRHTQFKATAKKTKPDKGSSCGDQLRSHSSQTQKERNMKDQNRTDYHNSKKQHFKSNYAPKSTPPTRLQQHQSKPQNAQQPPKKSRTAGTGLHSPRQHRESPQHLRKPD